MRSGPGWGRCCLGIRGRGTGGMITGWSSTGSFFRTRAGCPWRDLPGRFGNWKTVYNRHRRWSGDGTWEKILDQLRAGCDGAERRAWTVAVDATVVRAHQHAAGARHQPPADVDPERLAVAVLSAPVRIRG